MVTLTGLTSGRQLSESFTVTAAGIVPAGSNPALLAVVSLAAGCFLIIGGSLMVASPRTRRAVAC
jgi:hypothetical protein